MSGRLEMRIAADLLAQLDAYAAQCAVSRTMFVRLLIINYADDLKRKLRGNCPPIGMGVGSPMGGDYDPPMGDQ